MGEDVVDVAVSVAHLRPLNQSLTKDLKLLGACHYRPMLADELMAEEDLLPDIASHLASSYGDRAKAVLKMGGASKKTRIIAGFPYIEAEVSYALRCEYALHAIDVLARRMRLAFLDNRAAKKALPKIVALMARQLRWNHKRIHEEIDVGIRFLDTMLTNSASKKSFLPKLSKALDVSSCLELPCRQSQALTALNIAAIKHLKCQYSRYSNGKRNDASGARQKKCSTNYNDDEMGFTRPDKVLVLALNPPQLWAIKTKRLISAKEGRLLLPNPLVHCP